MNFNQYMNLKKYIAVSLSSAIMMGYGIHAFADSTEDLINAFVSKGYLTEEEGQLMLKGRKGEKEAAEKKSRNNPTLEVGKRAWLSKVRMASSASSWAVVCMPIGPAILVMSPWLAARRRLMVPRFVAVVLR